MEIGLGSRQTIKYSFQKGRNQKGSETNVKQDLESLLKKMVNHQISLSFTLHEE
jgi:hypothetical protein